MRQGNLWIVCKSTSYQEQGYMFFQIHEPCTKNLDKGIFNAMDWSELNGNKCNIEIEIEISASNKTIMESPMLAFHDSNEGFMICCKGEKLKLFQDRSNLLFIVLMSVKIACQKKLTLIIVIFNILVYLRYIFFGKSNFFWPIPVFFSRIFNTLNALNHKNIIITDSSGGQCNGISYGL